MSKLTISEAAKLKGVSVSTLRRWELEGKIIPERTPNGHRRYDLAQLLGVKSELSYTIGYCRVSSYDQKDDLERQKQVVELYCAQHGWQFEIIEDLGSGLNYSKRGLKRLIRLITESKVERLVLTHKDRLLRFGSELIFSLCQQFGTEIVIINRTEDSSFEEDLAQDVLEIITVFSARLYGSRSHKNKQIIEELKDIATRL
ncbi:IS607 family transposase [Sphaerospermopsis aphanizomenoides BCCUSP55]|uniref:IS607 family transposase n=1 Tax=Sphaerospermopsis aphanizomenoides TaxID=459663 RepID=UPI00190412FA|nr:IS607 family transposase [Sphaerospermopsis aphanizomenoides]MBK1986738.1 IS607 family transposase [Sphaerospermopsis aphanizomenoides BCCUSP55]